MKCPNCGFNRILPMYKYCPKCKQPLSASEAKDALKSVDPLHVHDTNLFTGVFWSYSKAMKDPSVFKEYAQKNPSDSAHLIIKWKEQGLDVSALVNSAPVSNISSSSDHLLDTPISSIGTVSTRNKSQKYITWTLAQNQFARNISAYEVTILSDADGVYVQEGVTAEIFVDGRIVSELEGGGLYRFASEKVLQEAASQYAEDEEDMQAHEGILKKIGRVGLSLLNLVFGKSNKARLEDNKKRHESIKEIAKKITGNSIVSVVLKRDGIVRPIAMGIRPVVSEDGSVRMEFAPYKIRTKTLTIDVAIEFEARITDFHEFRMTYLMDRNSYSASDLCISLNNMMRTTIQRLLQDYEADGQQLPAKLMASISFELMTQSLAMLHGIAICNVLDITTSNESFERYRMLEEKFYCTEKEIDALSRTNEFKNRLQSVENRQKIEEARSELDLRKELEKINNDHLIHDDEVDAFVQLLQSQKRIREAKTENEELSELLKLKGNRLVSEDELDALESSIRDKKFDREQVSATFQLTAAHQTEMVRVKLESELKKNQILAQAELNDVRFEELRKDLEREILLVDMQEEHDLTSDKRKDDYSDSRREKNFDFDQRQKETEYARTLREKKDNLDLEKQRNQNDVDILRQKAEIARQNLLAMQQHEQEMAEKTHKEEMARIAAQQNMSAEQLMATGIAGMDAAAQKAFAESFGVDKTAEIYERMIQMQSQHVAENNTASAIQMDQMRQILSQMMQFSQNTIQTIATGQSVQQQANLDAIQKVAGVRISQTEAMKEEYRHQMAHEQSRTDATQDKALNYTTKVTQERIKAEAKPSKSVSRNEEQMYRIPDFGLEYSLKEIGNFILNGIIDPDTELVINGETFTVAEVEELYPFLEKKYGNV